VGTLAAGVAHELGTPLNVISGRAELIASGKLSAEEIEMSARTIKSEAERMTSIIRQLLDFARQVPSPLVTVDVGKIASDACDSMRSLAKRSNVEIMLNRVGQTATVRGNSTQLQQVFTNLLSNAIQAMPGGGMIHVFLAQETDGNFISISVTDSGVGIERESLSRVFEPFYTTKDVGQGTGLGLSIAYGIVRGHGGEIKVESEPGKLTKFHVSLPLASESSNRSS
jgi:signal transduction histidine kinase